MKQKYLLGNMKRFCFKALGWALILAMLYLIKRQNYLLFHALAEMFSIAVAAAIFMLVWNIRRSLDNPYLLFIGVAYLFIGLLDLSHTLVYPDTGPFNRYAADLQSRISTASRYLESLSLLIGTFFLGRRPNLRLIVAGYIVVTALILGSIFHWPLFPNCFIEGMGPTAFQQRSAYIIVLVLAAAIAVLVRKNAQFDPAGLRYMVISIAFTLLSELCFSFFTDVYGVPYFLGHLFKLISFFCIYKAIIVLGMSKPFAVLFRNLKASERALRKAHDELERRVQDRTLALVGANRQLARQIEERKSAESALRESEMQLRYLSSQLLSAQENERKRISRELHDELGGALALLKLRISMIEKKLAPNQTAIRKDCRQNLQYIDQIIDEVRRLSRDLSPSILEDIGLTPALRWLIDNFVRNYGVKATAEIEAVDHLLPRDEQIMIYRTFQEALTNIGKHAHAGNVGIAAKIDEGRISFLVEDDGRGFDTAALSAKTFSEKGLGLATMNERARMLGGRFHLWSAQGKGTRIALSIPIQKEKNLDGELSCGVGR